jgi:hypothetical protein
MPHVITHHYLIISTYETELEQVQVTVVMALPGFDVELNARSFESALIFYKTWASNAAAGMPGAPHTVSAAPHTSNTSHTSTLYSQPPQTTTLYPPAGEHNLLPPASHSGGGGWKQVAQAQQLQQRAPPHTAAASAAAAYEPAAYEPTATTTSRLAEHACKESFASPSPSPLSHKTYGGGAGGGSGGSSW